MKYTTTELIVRIYSAMLNILKSRGADLESIGSLHYMNGNDSTAFDWIMNDRSCEFMMFYKSNDRGAIKMSINNDGTIDGYYWGDEGAGKGEYVDMKIIDSEEALYHTTVLTAVEVEYDLFDECVFDNEFFRAVEEIETDFELGIADAGAAAIEYGLVPDEDEEY